MRMGRFDRRWNHGGAMVFATVAKAAAHSVVWRHRVRASTMSRSTTDGEVHRPGRSRYLAASKCRQERSMQRSGAAANHGANHGDAASVGALMA